MFKKRAVFITAIVIGISLILSFPIMAFAAAGDTGTDGFYKWQELSDGTVSITEYTGSETSITIPSTLSLKTVSEIGSFVFADKTAITEIIIPGSIKTINNDAFKGCTGLTNITLNEGLEHICGEAFMGCNSLPSISIPNSVKYIDFATFKNCTNLATITFGASSQLLSFGESIFENCTAITAFSFPTEVNYIGSYAFTGCTKLASITIPQDVTIIERGTFKGCTALETATLNNGLTEIGGEAFRNCTDLSVITMPDSVEQISFLAFAGCTSLTDLEISINSSSLEYIGENAFNNCDALTSIELPKSMLGVVQEAFSGCDNLKTAVFYSQTTQLLQYNEDNGNFMDIFGSSSYSGCAGTGTTYLTEIQSFTASTAKEYTDYVNANVHGSDGHKITFHSLDVVLTNEDSGVTVSGDLNEDITLNVSTIATDSETYQNAVKNIGDDKILLLLDINLLLGNEKIELNGDVIVTIPIPQEYLGMDNLVIAYINAEGEITYLECTVNEDGTISFVTDHFSNYALMQKIETVKSTSPQTGDENYILIWITLCIMSMIAIYCIIRKRRMN